MHVTEQKICRYHVFNENHIAVGTGLTVDWAGAGSLYIYIQVHGIDVNSKVWWHCRKYTLGAVILPSHSKGLRGSS